MKSKTRSGPGAKPAAGTAPHPASQARARPQVLFYACADRNYESYVGLYVASALFHCPQAHAEVGLEDAEEFSRTNAGLVRELERLFGDRFVLRTVGWRTADDRKVKPNTVRFLNQPATAAEYVYIGDIDIIHLEPDFLDGHLAFMKKTGLPYSNSVRPGTARLTGLHLTRHDALYPLPELSDLDTVRENDEAILLEICRRKGLPAQDGEWYRPIHGIHVSPNRDAWGMVRNGQTRPGWGITKWKKQYLGFREAPALEGLWPLLGKASREVLRVCDAAVYEDRKISLPVVDRAERNVASSHFAEVFAAQQARRVPAAAARAASRATLELLPRLFPLFRKLEIRSLNDAGCGTFGWIAPVAEYMDAYQGFDVVEDVVEKNRAASPYPFSVLDVCEEVMPTADAILCRDVFVHLPVGLVSAALARFKASGARWLIATTYPDVTANAKGRVGGFRPVNLQRAPFDLPEPAHLLLEAPSQRPHPVFGRKAVGVWPLSAVRAAHLGASQ